ncbi:MAG: NADH-quinone oxidoreductase subunit NuoG [Anaerolineales bacterium]|nr:NADH-quinone oxidoreductase subunit NuoG [Anaerolineales bacterium]
MADLVTLTIDGVKVSVPKGTLIVDAAKRIDNDIPVFCYHPKLRPVGMCRMCLVEVGRVQRDRATGQIVVDEAGQPKIGYGPKLETACTTPVEDGMVVIGASAKVKDARDDVIEFILTSHPLDCPVCDKGGECPLQNLTLRHGPGTSRFLFGEKMRFEKHVPLGQPDEALIYLDRERCIQCARCTRFTTETVDDHVLGFYERGRRLEIVTFSEPGFDSKFSGNTTDICPVGALTTRDFRFGARPWELTPAASLCPHCPVGCNLTFSTRREAKAGGQPVIKRVLPRQNEAVNEIWLCDKGRFGYHFAESPARLTTPLVRQGDRLVESTWDEALALAAAKLKAAGAGLRVLAGGRLSNEDLFALKRVAEAQGGRAGLHSPMAGGEPVQRLGVGAGTNLGTLGKGAAILVVASDLEEEAPLWWLRVKQAAERGATLIVANLRPTKLDRYAKHKVRYQAGHEVAAVQGMLVAGSSDYAEAFAKATDAVIVFGREGLDFAGSAALAQACANLALATNHYGRPNNGLLAVWPHANDMGAWELGLPAQDPRQLLAGAAASWIAAADPVGDGRLSAADLRARGPVIVQELFLTETAQAADVVLPAAAWAERDGSYTSGERRVQRFYPAVPAHGRPDHQIAAELGARLGVALPKFASQVFLEIARSVPAFAGLDYAALAHVEPQFPDVGGRDLYYGGTSYANEQGLGLPLKSGAERGAAVTPHTVEVPHVAEGLRLVPVTVLYDRGTTFAASLLMQPRVTAAQARLNPADAARLGVRAGDEIELSGADWSVRVAAAVDEQTPAGVVLLPESAGVTVPPGPAPVAVNVPAAVR